MPYHIGLTQWQHPHWYNHATTPSLAQYAQHFTSVEGNNTFYGIPSVKQIQTWKDTVPEHFRFCFKFPKSISHEAELRHCQPQVIEFLNRITPLQQQIGVIWLQMSQQFSARQLDTLASFFQQLPSDFNYGIEVRHPDFFNKQNSERQFNRLLMQHTINRVMFDTRLLFSHIAHDAATRDALQKKPHVPLHVIATAQTPVVRFISPMDTHLADKEIDNWASKIIQWMDEGRTPYLFFHTPDNRESPQLAQRFSQKIHAIRPDILSLALWENKQAAQQTCLFE